MTTIPGSHEGLTWDERITRLSDLDDQVRAIRKEQAVLGAALVTRLDTYEQMIDQHKLDIDVPCGFRRGTNTPTFWEFAYLYDGHACFKHHCFSSHEDVYGDEELIVPLMALTHPEEWLLLVALADKTDVR